MLMEDKFTEECKKEGQYKAQLEVWVMQNWLEPFPTTPESQGDVAFI